MQRPAHRQNSDLLRRQPGREFPCVLLQHNAHEPLQTAEQRSMQHHRHLTTAVTRGKVDAELARKYQVKLDRAALPGPPPPVLQIELKLWTVERTAAGLL